MTTTPTTMRWPARLRAQLARLLSRWRVRSTPAEVGFAVRCDWPTASRGTVCHDFTRFTTSRKLAGRRAAATQRFWRPGPLRPLAVTVVPISRAEFGAHRPQCMSSVCPTTASLYGLTAGESAGVPA